MKKKFIFSQDAGHLGTSFVVVSGYNAKETLKFIKKIYTKEYYLKAKSLVDKFFDCEERSHYNAEVLHINDKPYILRFKGRVEDSWETWEILIHEITHVVDFYSTRGGFENEPENRAYLMEYLFREIRSKIQGVTKVE